jgi:hypothetical protein
MPQSRGYVTSDRWTVNQLHRCPAIWSIGTGDDPLVETTGVLSAVPWGKGMLVIFTTPQGNEWTLTQLDMDSASLKADGIFRFS